MYNDAFYDAITEDQPLDLICAQLAEACTRKAETKRRQRDNALAAAWQEDSERFMALAQRIGVANYHDIAAV